MNASMAGLLKGTCAVVVVVGGVVALVSGVFHYSPDGRDERHGNGAATPPPAVAAATPVTPSTAAQNAAPAPQIVAASPPAKARLGNDFSADASAWASLLAKSPKPDAGQALATAGRPAAGIVACASCHGAQGIPNAGTAFPGLAGLSPEYVAKQLTDFKAGERNNPLMTQIAKGLSDDDIGSLAIYYGALTAPSLTAPAQNETDRGRHLHDLGDNALALAACANCHGANGVGGGPLLPRLAGQPQQYLMDQLAAFRNGQRRNDDVGTMQSIATRLNPADSDAVTKFYAMMRR
jgi:cytochrome c553